MKLILMIIFILTFTIPCYSANRIYIGNNDQGQLITGIESTIKIQDITLVLDNLIEDLKWVGGGFSPDRITFTGGFNIGTWEFRHICKHTLDKYIDPIQGDIINSIKYNIIF